MIYCLVIFSFSSDYPVMHAPMQMILATSLSANLVKVIFASTYIRTVNSHQTLIDVSIFLTAVLFPRQTL